MGSSSLESSGKSYWFWGIVLSLSLHGIILILAFFWGFGAPNYSGEPQSIEGRLVSISELEGVGGREVKPSQPEKKESPPEPKKEETQKAEVKKEEPPNVKEEKPKEEKVEVSKAEKKEPPKETKKEEPKKVEVKKEEPPKVKEEPEKKDVVVLDSKEKQKEKEKKEEKKQVAEKPKPTEPPKTTPQKESQKKKEPSFEDIRRGVLEDMQKSVADKRRRSVIEDIEKSVEEEKQVAESDSHKEPGTQENSNQTGRSGSGAPRGMVTSLFIQRIREEIRSNWKVPQTIPTDTGLKTVVVFRIDEKGKVYDVRVEEPSGNPAFDDFCVKAIYKAAPLTPPPPELLEVAKTEGVEVTFSP